MKNGKLQCGDRVIVNWRHEKPISAKIIHTPAGAGDLWGYVTEDGAVCFINPYSKGFEAFVLEEIK